MVNETLPEKPIRILQIVGTMDAGGLENFIMNIYRKISRNEIQFDFLVHRKAKCYFEDEITALGGKIYHFSFSEDKNIQKYKRDLFAFFLAHPEYKIIHCHKRAFSLFYMKIAKKTTNPFIISHSHSAYSFVNVASNLTNFLNVTMSLSEKRLADDRLACGKKAGESLFGKYPFRLVYSAIDPERFSFSETAREQIRSSYKIPSDSLVIGNVGRFHEEKNQLFLLKCFREFLKKKKAYLFLVGNGKMEGILRAFVKKAKIDDSVFILVNPKNIESFYSAFDLFVLPSSFEGFPLTAIEAQDSGLPVFCSNHVTTESDITGQVSFLPLKEKNWVYAFQNFHFVSNDSRKCAFSKIKGTPFDIDTTTSFFENYYERLAQSLQQRKTNGHHL